MKRNRANAPQRFRAIAQEGGQTTVFRIEAQDRSTSDHALVFHNRNIEAWYRGSGLNPLRQYVLRRVAYDAMTLILLAVSAILFLRRSHEAVAAAFSLLPTNSALVWRGIWRDGCSSFHHLSTINIDSLTLQ